MSTDNSSPAADAAVEALKRGMMPLPLLRGQKIPFGAGWPRPRWDLANPPTDDEVRRQWGELETAGAGNIGLLLGEHGGRLVDVDLDHPITRGLKSLLPKTDMRSGRPHNPNSHYWYIVEPGTLQGTRQFKMPDKSMIIEYRSTGGQSAIPPSIHPDGEDYRWEGLAFGGDVGPAVVDGRVLAVQVAMLALASVLVAHWPRKGSRHEAYLALAGGLLRHGDQVHPYWERNAPMLIEAIADATNDHDGGDARISESVPSTISGLRAGRKITGWGKLAEFIGDDAVRQSRHILGELEALAGERSRNATAASAPAVAYVALDAEDAATDPGDGKVHQQLTGSWEPIDLEPYITGQIVLPEPSLLMRNDGAYLMYPGRVNMVFGNSETAKSWIVLWACVQEMGAGGRALYLDFEDDASNTISRLQLMKAGDDNIRKSFRYLSPFAPHQAMQRDTWGQPFTTPEGVANRLALNGSRPEDPEELQGHVGILKSFDPTVIVVDGMTELYGIHHLNTNDTSSTSVITEWLKSLTENGRRSVIVIDHAPKDAARGAMPIGSQHKVSMVQGTLLQTHLKTQPMPGAIGQIELVVLKDRPGRVRAVSGVSGKAQTAAVVTIDSTRPDDTVMTVAAPSSVLQTAGGIVNVDLNSDKAQRAIKASSVRLAQIEVMRWVFRGDRDVHLRREEIRQAFGYSPSQVNYMVAWMLEQKQLVQYGATNSRYGLPFSVDGYDVDAPELEHLDLLKAEDLKGLEDA